MIEIEKRKGQDNLKCMLTDDELLEYGKLQARYLNDIQVAEDELATYKTAHKNKVTAIQANVNILGNRIRNGYEHRMVDTEIHVDYENDIVKFYRMDTGENYGSRRLNAEEKQHKLDLQLKDDVGSTK